MSGERAMADSVPTTGLASTNDTNEKATMAMEMDDASAFAMSLDALAEANPSDQLYDDLTRKSPKMQDNPQDHERKPNQAKTTTTSLATIKTEPQSKSPVMALASLSVPVRRSPRNHATSKTSTGSTKKTTSGTKRSNQNPPPAFSWNDILHVQSLIERCLQQLLTKNDIVLTLQTQAKVDPAFTAVVWQKLEEQNPAFFRAYALQLQLKEQITAFNFLVSQQKEMMAKASGNAAFLSFLASSDARKNQRQNMLRTSRLTSVPQRKTNTPSPVDAAPFPTSSTTTSSAMEMVKSSVSQGFPLSSPLPLPSPMKTDLDTQAFFS